MKAVYRKSFGLFLVAVLLYFFGKVAYREWDKIASYDWMPQISWFLSSLIILLFTYVVVANGWILVLKMLGVRISWIRGVCIFLLSLYGRYVPGGVWSVLGRVYLCRLEGIPDSRSSMSILLEQAYPIVSAGLVFAASLLFWTDTSSVLRVLPAVLLLPISFVFLHPKPFLKIMNPVLSWFGKGPIHISLSFNNMLILTAYYAFYWLMAGIAFYLFIRAFYPLGLNYIPILSGIYAISFAAGYLAFFTPAGLGVREGSLVILLSLFLPTPVAIGISLLSRLWLIGAEVIILLIFMINAETRRMARTALGW